MTPERWRQIETLYHRAAEQPTDQRGAWLVKACEGDSDLRRDVESLLAHDSSDGRTLARGHGRKPLTPGRRIGHSDRDFGHTDVEMTFDDPRVYTRPFTVRIPHNPMAADDIFEMFPQNEKTAIAS